MIPALLWLAAAAAAPPGAGGPWSSSAGHFLLDYESDLQPLTINRMHAWRLHLETAGGEAVEGAVIRVSGGMPAHDHGLATAPRVTAELGGGAYRLDGLRFHMNGYWEMRVEIEADGVRDVVVIPLEL